MAAQRANYNSHRPLHLSLGAFPRRAARDVTGRAMKPPSRPRWAPVRFVTGAAAPDRARAAWSEREKRAVLAALRDQARDRDRERDRDQAPCAELQARPFRERLPRRSEAEIQAFLCRLRGRAAREALCGQYRHRLRPQHRGRPAPIEVWLDLASVLSEGLEEAATAAFGQVFTVAGTEPLSLSLAPPSEPPRSQSEPIPSEPRPSEHRSSQPEPIPPEPRPSEHRSSQPEPIPPEPRPSEHRSSQPEPIPPEPRPSEPPRSQSEPVPPEPRPSSPCPLPSAPPLGQSEAAPPEPRPLRVDFQRVYEYLGRLSRDGGGPAPPPGESLLLLALLGSLPMELGVLDLGALRNHFRGVYSDLTGPPPGPAPPGPASSPWQGVGLSPLNLFRVPLRLLGRGGEASG